MVDSAQTNETAIARSDSKAVVSAIELGGFGQLQPKTFGELMEWAKLVAHSGMVPKDYNGNPGAVLVSIQMGAELGLKPLQSLQNIANINGRPSIWGDAAWALVTSHPDCVNAREECDGSKATCTIHRRGRDPVVRSFTADDAKRAGLWGKQGPWTNYPQRMLQMRARSWAARDAFADVLKGISMVEEARDAEHTIAEPQIVEAQKPSTPKTQQVLERMRQAKRVDTQPDAEPTPNTEQPKAADVEQPELKMPARRTREPGEEG